MCLNPPFPPSPPPLNSQRQKTHGTLRLQKVTTGREGLETNPGHGDDPFKPRSRHGSEKGPRQMLEVFLKSAPFLKVILASCVCYDTATISTVAVPVLVVLVVVVVVSFFATVVAGVVLILAVVILIRPGARAQCCCARLCCLNGCLRRSYTCRCTRST